MYRYFILFSVILFTSIQVNAQKATGYDENRAYGLVYFHRSDYATAIKYFLKAEQAEDIPKYYDVDLLKERAIQCAKLTREGDEFLEIAYYSDALNDYRKVLILNPSDKKCPAKIAELNKFVLDDNIYNFKNDNVVKVIQSEQSEEKAEQGYYVVPYTFKSLTLAETEAAKLLETGILAEIVYNPTRKWYYVYSHNLKNLQIALLKKEEMLAKGYIESVIHIY